MKKVIGRLTSRLSTFRPSLLALGLISTVVLLSSPLQAVALLPGGEEASATPNFVGVWSGANSYNLNDVVSYGGSLYINVLVTAPWLTTTVTPGAGPNRFDSSATVQDQLIVESTGALAPFPGFQSSGLINVGGASSFVTNITIYIAAPWGIAFYDSYSSYMSGTFLNTFGYVAPGTPIPVPAGATYVRFWWPNGGMGTTPDAAVVNIGSTLQSSYTPYAGSTSTTSTTPSPAPTDALHWTLYNASPTTTTPTTTTTAPGPWVGKKMFLLGDSIVWTNPAVAGQISSAIGAVPSSQGATGPGIDAFPGRTFDGFENGQNGAIYVPVSAAVLADVDLMVVALGTNQDSGSGIGSVTDSPNLNGTMSAQMRAMLETIMGFKPGMRIVVVGPYQTNRYNVPAGTDGLQGSQDSAQSVANSQSLAVLRNINTAMRAVCNLYAIPYIDMFNESGVNFSTSALWLKDGLHPNGLGYSTFYVPYIAAQLSHYAQ